MLRMLILVVEASIRKVIMLKFRVLRYFCKDYTTNLSLDGLKKFLIKRKESTCNNYSMGQKDFFSLSE